jgi:hypothetical protein
MSEIFLNFKGSTESKDWTGSLPSLDVEWKCEYLEDYSAWQVFKHCYDTQRNEMRWVPLSQTFTSIPEAQAAISVHLRAHRTIYLDSKGDIVPS